MLKVLTIIGARPQIIKAAAISRAIRHNFSNKIQEFILHTGQHYDSNMSEVFFQEMNIPVPYKNLNIGSLNRKKQIELMQTGIENEIENVKPHVLLLYGDTNSTYAGAMAGTNKQLDVVHIEAGLRSYNNEMPEEENRIVADHHSTILFAPTLLAVNNLSKEGIGVNTQTPYSKTNQRVCHSGDVMYDNVLYYSEHNNLISNISEDNLKQDYVLATVHRNYNTDILGNMEQICDAIIHIANEHNINFIIPLHPRTKKILESDLKLSYNKLKHEPGITIIEPVSYLEMVTLLKNCRMVMTDSGGLQKESYFFKKPCVVLRSETEWQELVDNGNNILAHGSASMIVDAFNTLYTKSDFTFPEFYGNGYAAELICNEMLTHLS